MTQQLALQPAPDAFRDRQREIRAAVKAAHAERPDDRLLHITDPGLGAEYIASIAPDNEWFELLPDWQACEVTRAHP